MTAHKRNLLLLIVAAALLLSGPAAAQVLSADKDVTYAQMVAAQTEDTLTVVDSKREGKTIGPVADTARFLHDPDELLVIVTTHNGKRVMYLNCEFLTQDDTLLAIKQRSGVDDAYCMGVGFAYDFTAGLRKGTAVD